MSDKSRIEWCDATLNPSCGCSPVSPGCVNCYAARMAHRMAANIKIPPYFTGLTDASGKWTGKINLHARLMKQALRWQKPRRIFVGSMSDLFHEDVPDEFLDQVFAYMALAPQHIFMLLTKRPERMRRYFQLCENAKWNNVRDAINHPVLSGQGNRKGALETPLPNVWLGVTVESQAQADERIPVLLETSAAKRFVSIEPMLGPVDLTCIGYPDAVDREVGLLDALRGMTCDDAPTHPALDWVICGGESGPSSRPMHPDWARGLRDQCVAAGVPFFFKQWGEWLPCSAMGDEEEAPDVPYGFIDDDGVFDPGQDGAFHCRNGVKSEQTFRVGKHRAGRLLDGVEHNAFPKEAA